MCTNFHSSSGNYFNGKMKLYAYAKIGHVYTDVKNNDKTIN